MNVATSVGAMMAVGLVEPAAASTPIIDAGISCTPEVVTAMNVTIGLVAVSLSGFSVWSSSIALMPSGVAALFSPSMFAASASTMAPAAGMPGRHLGKHPAQQRAAARGRRAPRAPPPRPRASCPSQSVMIADQADRDLTAVDADSTAPLVTASAVPLNAATTSATAMRPNQM